MGPNVSKRIDKTGDEGVGARLKESRRMRGVSQTKLAELAGISKATLIRHESGERSPSSRDVVTIAEALEVDLGWLLTGDGVAPQGLESFRVKEPPAEQSVVIPLIAARVGAGQGDLGDDAFDGTYPLHSEDAAALGHPRVLLRAVRVRGDSMEPNLSDGDTVIVAQDADALDGVVVLSLGGAVIVKSVQRLPGGKLRIVSENPKYEALDASPEDDVRVIGRVVMRIQRGMR